MSPPSWISLGPITVSDSTTDIHHIVVKSYDVPCVGKRLLPVTWVLIANLLKLFLSIKSGFALIFKFNL